MFMFLPAVRSTINATFVGALVACKSIDGGHLGLPANWPKHWPSNKSGPSAAPCPAPFDMYLVRWISMSMTGVNKWLHHSLVFP